MAYKIKTVRPVAPEDLRPGQYITVMSIVYTESPFLYASDVGGDEVPMARMRDVPGFSGAPFRVLDVCLPFIAVECNCGCKRPVRIDLRRETIARVSKRYAKAHFKAAEAARAMKNAKKA